MPVKRHAPNPLPTLEQYRGKPLRTFLSALLDWLRLLAETVGAGDRPLVLLAYTSGSISARSGTTAGSGTVNIVTWNGTALSNSSSNGTMTVYNAYGTAFSTSKYVWCVRFLGVYWAITQEC